MRIIRWLFIFTLFSLPYGARAAGQFDLKGDVLGESLSVFKARHPRAMCQLWSDVTTECRDSNVEFAGYAGRMWADFYHGRLIGIGYSINSAASDILAQFTRKFGKPSLLHEDDLIINSWWDRGDEELSLCVVLSPTIGQLGTSVRLETRKDPRAGDI